MVVSHFAMARLAEIVSYCEQRLDLPGFPDYPGAVNGLQMENDGEVTRIGSAVDAGLEPFRQAADAGVDFLIVHHGMFWESPRPWTGPTREKLDLLVRSNLAVFGAHLPLDAHPEIGNNALLAANLDLESRRTFLSFQGRDIGLVTAGGVSREELRRRLGSLFPQRIDIEHGSETPAEIAIVTGGGYGAIEDMIALGVDTLITGELKEHCFNLAQEHRLNLYACGHYATEVFGVNALAQEVAEHFDLPWSIIETSNPL